MKGSKMGYFNNLKVYFFILKKTIENSESVVSNVLN